MNAALVMLLTLTTTSSSNLGVYALGPASDADTYTALRACPRIAAFEAGPAAVVDVPYFTGLCPESKVLVHLWLAANPPFQTTNDAAATAVDAWNRMNGSLAGLIAQQIDYVSVLDPENLPAGWDHSDTMPDWVARFWSQMADLIEAAGYTPVVGALGSGQPALRGEDGIGTENRFKPIADAMKQKAYPWAWSYRAFSASLSWDPAAQQLTALRYRRILEECSLDGVPVLLERAALRTDSGEGWKSTTFSKQAYLGWLHWLDMQTRSDLEVAGVAVYQFGARGGAAASFDVSGVASDFVALLSDDSTPDAGPGGGDAGPGGRDGGSGGSNGGTGGQDWGGQPGPINRGCGCSSSGALGPALGLLGLLGLLARRAGHGAGRATGSRRR